MPKNYYMPSFNDEYAIPEGLIAGIGSPDNLSGLTQQPDASRVAGAYDYVPLYGAGDIVPGLTAEIFKNLGIENPNVPVFELLGSENKGGKNANERMTFAAQPGQEYRLVNKATGEVLGQASTPEGISALVQQSNALSKQLGKKADIAFEQSIPEALGGGFTPIFRDEPNILFDTPAKLIAAAMLLATGAGLAQPGGLGGIGATGTTGATGAGTVGTAGIGSTAVAPTVAASAPAAFEAAPLVITAPKVASAAVPALLTSAATAPALLSSASPPPQAPQAPQPTQPTVAAPASTFPEELVVTAKNAAPIALGDVAPVLLPSVGAALASSIGATATPPLAEPVADKGFLGTGLSASELLTLSGAGLAGLQGLTGGGGGGGGTRAPDTTGLTFRPSTLRPTTRAVGIGGAGGSYPYTPTTYGRAGGDQEAEYLFFTHEPLPSEPASAPAAPGKKEGGEMHGDMVKHLVEYHKNGGHYGPGQVKGIGSGQEDLIPAWLSDGEYVWSAQDVADLGDGSTDEGVRRLDKMRQMVRRQAGRKDVKKIAKPQKGIDKMLKAVGGLA